jgi:hypothetical protein
LYAFYQISFGAVVNTAADFDLGKGWNTKDEKDDIGYNVFQFLNNFKSMVKRQSLKVLFVLVVIMVVFVPPR